MFVYRSVRSNLPPPPVSSPLPQIRSTGPTENGNKKQATASTHFSASSKTDQLLNGSVKDERVGVASVDKSGTLDITNPFKFDTIPRMDEDDAEAGIAGISKLLLKQLPQLCQICLGRRECKLHLEAGKTPVYYV